MKGHSKVQCEKGHIFRLVELTRYPENWNMKYLKDVRCPDCHVKTRWTEIP